MRGIMIQGTASDVGKSLLTTALCRMLANDGFNVAPFKSQNMTNNTYATENGKVISYAQALQSEAARSEPVKWMNPIVLNTQANQKARIFILGESLEIVTGREYRERYYEKGLEAIEKSFSFLENHYDAVIMEGAGSPVEINLKDKELVNMKVAGLADVAVLLVADIDRGGVFASIVGTLKLLTAEERSRVKGIIINKFRGDHFLFEEGKRWIEKKTSIPVLGIVPYVDHHIKAEDSLSEKNCSSQNKIPGNILWNEYDEIANKIIPYLNYKEIKKIMWKWKET